jgi:DNA-binding cell septation regulator SpoVG
MTAPIEVLAIRKLDGASSVKAFVDVQIGAIALKGCKIVQQDGHRAWIATPSVKTNHGWQNVVEITSKDLRHRITDVVLAAWEAADGDRVPLPERGRQGWS